VTRRHADVWDYVGKSSSVQEFIRWCEAVIFILTGSSSRSLEPCWSENVLLCYRDTDIIL